MLSLFVKAGLIMEARSSKYYGNFPKKSDLENYFLQLKEIESKNIPSDFSIKNQKSCCLYYLTKYDKKIFNSLC